MAVVAPIPNASVNTAVTVKPMFFTNVRMLKLRFCLSASHMVLLLAADCRLPIVDCPIADFSVTESINCQIFQLRLLLPIANRQLSIGNLFHSYLNATNGSTFVARRAGI